MFAARCAPSWKLGAVGAWAGAGVAYGMGSQVDERRSRTPELGVQSGLRAGPREGLGAGVRERLE